MKWIEKMARNKGSKEIRRRRLRFHDFLISKNQGSYLILDNVGLKKRVSQLITRDNGFINS